MPSPGREHSRMPGRAPINGQRTVTDVMSSSRRTLSPRRREAGLARFAPQSARKHFVSPKAAEPRGAKRRPVFRTVARSRRLRARRRGAPARAKKKGPRRGPSFAEPITLSSTDPVDFRLPATAPEIDFDLLASRTRRRRDTRAGDDRMQGDSAAETGEVHAICKLFFFPHFHSELCNLWITASL
jgi:hypothetical protein